MGRPRTTRNVKKAQAEDTSSSAKIQKRKRKKSENSSDDNIKPTSKRQKRIPKAESNEITSVSQGKIKPSSSTRPKRKVRKVRKVKEEKIKKEPGLQIHKGDENIDQLKEEKVKDSKVNIKKEKGIMSTFSGRVTKYVGAHTSIAGGLHNAVLEAVELGAKAFGMFLKSQRQWQAKPMEDAAAEKFRDACEKHGFSPQHIVPHGSYLINCGSPKEETLQKSRDCLVDELQRAERLGLAIYNFHPGSSCGEITTDECMDRIGESINLAHKKTKYIIVVIENMCCQGNTVGGKFEELKGIINRVKNKSRIGVCLDTCHAFAAGYDLSTEKGYIETMDRFQQIVGFKYLKAIHVNDSKGDVGCHLDRHENIGRGKIGLDGFKRFMNDPRFDGIPFVLETPQTNYATEIKRLYRLCKT